MQCILRIRLFSGKMRKVVKVKGVIEVELSCVWSLWCDLVVVCLSVASCFVCVLLVTVQWRSMWRSCLAPRETHVYVAQLWFLEK